VENDALKRVGTLEIVPADLTEFRQLFDDYRYGRFHRGTLGAGGTLTVNVQTNHDPGRAPDGQATINLYTFASYELADGGAAQWDNVKEAVADQMLTDFRKFTTNMDAPNILGRFVDSPLDMERSSASFQKGDLHGVGTALHQNAGFRPLPELAQYRVPGIERLYLVGPFLHPGGGVFGGGRATAMAIMQDLGLDFEKVSSRS
jgi:phytoene dehydrogenase-like protein